MQISLLYYYKIYRNCLKLFLGHLSSLWRRAPNHLCNKSVSMARSLKWFWAVLTFLVIFLQHLLRPETWFIGQNLVKVIQKEVFEQPEKKIFWTKRPCQWWFPQVETSEYIIVPPLHWAHSAFSQVVILALSNPKIWILATSQAGNNFIHYPEAWILSKLHIHKAVSTLYPATLNFSR